MRTASVFTHFRCNQRCTYCTFRRSEDDPAFIARASVEARVAAALTTGASEIAFTGGEPTMRGDLHHLVAYAKARGAQRVVLETNATLVDNTRAVELRASGLDAARVNLIGASAVVDAITRDPGGFAATVAGIRALAIAGVEVHVQVVLVRSTMAHIAAIPSLLASELRGMVSGITLVLPVVVDSVPGADPEAEVLRYDAASPVIVALADASRAAGVALKFAPETAPPPCSVPDVTRVAHLFTLTRGAPVRTDHARIGACASCTVADRCDGFATAYLRRFGEPDVRPIIDDRLRRRLSLIATVGEQIARELVTHDRYASLDGNSVEEDLIRVIFSCNQSCRFCFVSTHLPTAERVTIEAAIVDAGRAGRRITLSGGEPTLSPHLLDFIRLAKSTSPHPIRIQTNAVRLAYTELADSVVEAGISEAFVSLHGSRADIGDAVTHAPGTYEKSLLGIDHLVERGVAVILNFVICESNFDDLVPFVEMVGARWPSASVNISFVAPSTDVVPREREFIPRYSDAMPHLRNAIVRARVLGVSLVGFESMCGVPLCQLPDVLDPYLALGEIPAGYDRGEFMQADVCASCDLAGRCYGVRRGYADLYGTSELRAIHLRSTDPA